jgi:hypothetical protein
MPRLQLTLRQLLAVTTLVGIVLGVYKLAGVTAFVHYAFLVFAVGPWFAYLASECLPIASPPVRTAIANFILLVLFAVGMQLAEWMFDAPAVLIAGLAALLLWTPQYLLFIVWGDPQPNV